MRKVDVAIIGAGHAGLNALSEVRRAGCSRVLIDGGPPVATRARAGCVPSRAIIELAQQRRVSGGTGGTGGMAGNGIRADRPALIEGVGGLRDTPLDPVPADGIEGMMEDRELLRGQARFLEPDLLDVDGERIRAGRIVVGTSRNTV